MKIIFAEHDCCNRDFLFEVPDSMHPIKGDILWVDTQKGETIATATSDVVEVNNVEQLVEKFGAYLPLKKVITYANSGIKTYIANIAYENVVRYCCDNQANVYNNDLPF